MTKSEQIFIAKNMAYEELNNKIKTLEKNLKVLKRLYFVKFRYEGHSVAEAAKMVGVTKMVGYLWQERWNKNGYEGLIPKFAGGRPSKLSNQDFNLLIQILKKRDDWTTEDVQVLIKEKFGITFSLKHIRTILRKIGMKYSKPYQHDYRKPKDAEDILKKT